MHVCMYVRTHARTFRRMYVTVLVAGSHVCMLAFMHVFVHVHQPLAYSRNSNTQGI